ncbi:hypothetical protein AB1Y20_010703 [Prymnesium parvum]
MPFSFRKRTSWKLPVLLLFVVPHDPSSRVQEVGSWGFIISPSTHSPLSLYASRGTARKVLSSTMVLRFVDAPQPFHEQFSDMLHAQLDHRHIRSVRVAQWRIQRLLRALSQKLNLWTWPTAAPAMSVDTSSDALASALSMPSTVNTSYIPTSVHELRQVYGKKQHWYGDLSLSETRKLYKSLMPTSLSEADTIPLSLRARMAVRARLAARLYARERAILPVGTGSQLFDVCRHLIENGKFQPNGLSEEQIFSKYAELLGLAPPDFNSDADDAAYEELYLTILRKSCSTNAKVDAWTEALCSNGASDNASPAADALRSIALTCQQHFS